MEKRLYGKETTQKRDYNTQRENYTGNDYIKKIQYKGNTTTQREIRWRKDYTERDYIEKITLEISFIQEKTTFKMISEK